MNKKTLDISLRTFKVIGSICTVIYFTTILPNIYNQQESQSNKQHSKTKAENVQIYQGPKGYHYVSSNIDEGNLEGLVLFDGKYTEKANGDTIIYQGPFNYKEKGKTTDMTDGLVTLAKNI